MNTHIVTQVDIAIITEEGGSPCLKLFENGGGHWKMIAFAKRLATSGWWVSVNEISYAAAEAHTQNYVVTFVPEVIAGIFRGLVVPIQGRADYEIEQRILSLKVLVPGVDFSGPFPRGF